MHLKAEYIWEMRAQYSVQNLYLPVSNLNRLTGLHRTTVQGPQDELYVRKTWSHTVREQNRYSDEVNICTSEIRSNKRMEKITK
jgi:hypothetical protein